MSYLSVNSQLIICFRYLLKTSLMYNLFIISIYHVEYYIILRITAIFTVPWCRYLLANWDDFYPSRYDTAQTHPHTHTVRVALLTYILNIYFLFMCLVQRGPMIHRRWMYWFYNYFMCIWCLYTSNTYCIYVR